MKALKTASVLVISTFVLAACGERPPEKKASQVVAKVNGGEISVHQVNFVLQRTQGVTQAQAESAKKQVLEGLIDQELAVQQAQEAKLDRTPEVMQALDVARREILSRAYLEQASSVKAKPSAEEIKQYFTAHPELFSNRKIYRMEEVYFASTPVNVALVKEQLSKGKSPVEIGTGLKNAGIEVGGGQTVKPAEQLSLELLPKLAQAKEGQPQLYEGAGRAAIITVLATKSEPIDEAKAKPVIENFLINQKKTELAREAMKQLRAKAKIEYAGEFADNKPAGAIPAAAGADKPAEKPASGDAAINKGVAALK